VQGYVSDVVSVSHPRLPCPLSLLAGSHIQLAGRERQIQGLSERLLCLTGSLASNVAAARYILQILHEDPSGKYDNVSTSYRGYVASYSNDLM
jgi:hypothetical protein